MKYIVNAISTVSLCVAAILIAPVASAQAPDHTQHANAHPSAVEMASGQIVKVDKDAAKLTIKHGPLVSLKMPGMTMAFKVRNPAMLDQVKTGDKVSFVAESVNGALTVTTLEVAK